MIGRRAAAVGIATKLGNHSFRATGITVYLKNGGTLEKGRSDGEPRLDSHDAALMIVARRGQPRRGRTDYDRTFRLILGCKVAHVFISYVRANAKAIDRLADDLKRNGVNVWLDRNDIEPGARWQDAIKKAIQSGKFFIACFSREYSERDRTFMNEELTIAIDELRARPSDRTWFIPILINETTIPVRRISNVEDLSSINASKLYEDWDREIKRILRVLKYDDPVFARIWHLVEVLDRPFDNERLYAVQQLGEIGIAEESVVSALVRAYDGQHGKIKNAALEALGRLKPAAVGALSVFIKALKDRDRDVRLTAINVALAMMGPATAEAASAVAGALNVARTLMIALRTHRAQLKIEDSSLERAGEVRLSHAIEMLLEAWQQCERSGLTNELRATAPIKANNSDSVEAEFSALIDWCRSDSDILKVMQTDLLRAISHFGEATFALARSGTESPIQARIREYGHPTRARVLPMVAGAPGPIDFFSPQLRGLQRVSDLEEAMGKLDSDTAERYVACSLLFACQGRWDLAAVYADSAIAVARLQQTNEAANIADEARLLRAQIHRLGGGTERERSKSDELLRRYERTGRMLTEIALPRDPRVPREQAAQLLELCLSVDQENGDLPSLAKGIDLLHKALDWARRDDLLRSRILELGLNYHLAARDRPGLWPERTDADEIVASRWHQELHSILEHQRQHLMMDEISRRARAMEIIGFRLVPQKPNADDEVLSRWAARARSEKPLRVPLNLRSDVGYLRDQLKRSNDQTAAMIQVELESILRRLYIWRPRDLIYAPIWAAYDVAHIVSLINDQGLRKLAGEAYTLLKKVAGATQHAGIQPDDRAPLQEVAAEFARIAGLLQTQSSGRSLEATNALFYLRMENCYARLLRTRIEREEERQKLLSELESDYRVIALDYPGASIPHFRLNLILSEMERREDAFDELNKALRLVEQDPFLQTPNHWVRSTMERRLAAVLSRGAEETLDQLKEYPNDQLRDHVLTDLLNAFKILYEGWRMPESPEVDYLRQLEAHRRINNIVYIASLIFTVDPRGAGLLKLGFDRHKMLSLLERLLHGGRIDEITELNVVHTVGYASAILGDFPNSVRAGHQVIKLLIETGDSPREDPNVARILTDALAWFASAQDGLSFRS
jgi:hypothetical protein